MDRIPNGPPSKKSSLTLFCFEVIGCILCALIICSLLNSKYHWRTSQMEKSSALVNSPDFYKIATVDLFCKKLSQRELSTKFTKFVMECKVSHVLSKENTVVYQCEVSAPVPISSPTDWMVCSAPTGTLNIDSSSLLKGERK